MRIGHLEGPVEAFFKKGVKVSFMSPVVDWAALAGQGKTLGQDELFCPKDPDDPAIVSE